MSTEKIVAFQGEVMLLSWGDTSTRGRTVTFQLPEGEGDVDHPFRHFSIKSGKTAGRRFMAVLVEIGDDEKPVEKRPSQLAFLLCRDKAFWHFADERSFDSIDNEEAARAYILTACSISSRSQLDSNPSARAAWEAVIWQPWLKYQSIVKDVL